MMNPIVRTDYQRPYARMGTIAAGGAENLGQLAEMWALRKNTKEYKKQMVLDFGGKYGDPNMKALDRYLSGIPELTAEKIEEAVGSFAEKIDTFESNKKANKGASFVAPTVFGGADNYAKSQKPIEVSWQQQKEQERVKEEEELKRGRRQTALEEGQFIAGGVPMEGSQEEVKSRLAQGESTADLAGQDIDLLVGGRQSQAQIDKKKYDDASLWLAKARNKRADTQMDENALAEGRKAYDTFLRENKVADAAIRNANKEISGVEKQVSDLKDKLQAGDIFDKEYERDVAPLNKEIKELNESVVKLDVERDQAKTNMNAALSYMEEDRKFAQKREQEITKARKIKSESEKRSATKKADEQRQSLIGNYSSYLNAPSRNQNVVPLRPEMEVVSRPSERSIVTTSGSKYKIRKK